MPMADRQTLLRTIVAIGAAALAAGTLPARAQQAPPTAVFLIDGSGSMWGNLGEEKQNKLDLSREALRGLLPSLRPDARVGLASFGHRRRGSCGDAEVIIPPDAGAAERLAVPVDKLNAVGKGPIALALRETAKAIAGANPASIILLADDVDNCGQDLCAAMEQIRQTSPGLVVHTIGLGLDKPRLDQISCLARLTGGKLWDAQTSTGLVSALAQAVAIADLQTGAKPAVAAAEDEAPKKEEGAPPGLYLAARLGNSGAALTTPVHWRITRAGSDGELVREALAPSLYEKLPAGTYGVEARLGLARVQRTVDVAADAPTPVRIDLDAGVLKLQGRPADIAGPRSETVFTVTAAGAEKDAPPLWIGREAQPEIVVPAGDYKVDAEAGLARSQGPATVAPANGTTYTPALVSGQLTLSATRGTAGDQGEALADGVVFVLYQDDPDAPQGRREVARSAAASPTFILPAGTYYATARTATAEAREQLAIGEGDNVTRVLPLALAHLRLGATLSGQPVTDEQPVTFRIIRLDPTPHEVTHTITREPEIDVSAGRYRLEAALADSNVAAAVDLSLAAGQAQKVTLHLDAGSVTLRGTDPAVASGSAGVYWEVRDSQERPVLRSSRAQPTALLAPGRYTVIADTAAGTTSSAIDVKADEIRTYDIGTP